MGFSFFHRIGGLALEGYFACFFLFSSLAFVASVAFVSIWLLWLYNALPIYLSVCLSIYLTN